MRCLFKRLICALQFLTRLPAWPQIEADTEDFARSMAFFPLVGLLIGGIMAAVHWATSGILIPEAVAALIILTEVLVTGALHLDGFMDTMDGLFCGRTRERRLEILRDSRVGAHSVVSVMVLFLVRWSLLLQLLSLPTEIVAPALVVMPAVGRLTMVLATYFFLYLRPQGLGKVFAEALTPVDVGVALITTLLAGGLLLEMSGVVTIIAAVGAAMMAAAAVSRLLGGLTGDVYGWISENTETIWLLLFVLVVQWL